MRKVLAQSLTRGCALCLLIGKSAGRKINFNQLLGFRCRIFIDSGVSPVPHKYLYHVFVQIICLVMYCHCHNYELKVKNYKKTMYFFGIDNLQINVNNYYRFSRNYRSRVSYFNFSKALKPSI